MADEIAPCSEHPVVCASNYQDLWWPPYQNGMGISIAQQGNTIVATWYHYDDKGNPVWLQASGKLDMQLRSLCRPTSFVCFGVPIIISTAALDNVSLYRSTGPAPSPDYATATVETTPVGTASIIFYSASSADLEYTYNGKSSALLLSRYTFSVPSLAGKWRFAALVTDDDTGEDASHSGSAVFSDAGASGNTRTYSIAGDLAAHPALDFRSFNLRSDGSLLVGSGCETGDVQKRCTVSKARLIGDTLLLEGTVETGPDTSRYNPFRLMAVRATD